MKTISIAARALSIVVILALAAPAGAAIDATLIGTAGNWSNSANWNGGVVGGTGGGDTVRLSCTGPAVINVDVSPTFTWLYRQTGTQNVTFNGGTVTLVASGEMPSIGAAGGYGSYAANATPGQVITINSVVAGTDGLYADPTAWNLGGNIILGNTANTYTGQTRIGGGVANNIRWGLEIVADGSLGQAPASPTAASIDFVGGNLRIGNAAGITINSNRGIQMDNWGAIVTTGGTTTYGGVIAGGNQVLVKDGAGSLLLSGANTWSGTVNLRGGTLLVGNNAALGTGASNIVIGDGAMIDPAATLALLTNGPYTIARNLTVNNNGGGTTLGGNTADSSTFSGAITLNKGVSLTAAAGGTVNFTGVLSGGGGVTMVGGGTAILSNTANTYGGGTTVNSGTLQINGGLGALPGNVTLGGGTLAFNFTNYNVGKTYTLTANSSVGVLAGQQINFSGAAFTGTSQLTKGGGGVMFFNGATTSASVSRINVASGALGTDSGSTGAPVTMTVFGGGTCPINVADGASLTIWNNTFNPNPVTLNGSLAGGGLTGGNAAAANNGFSGTITLAVTSGVGGSTGDFSITGRVTGPGGLTKVGTNTVVLSGACDYAGATTINQGTLRLQAAPTAPVGGSALWLDGADAATMFKDVSGTQAVSASGDPIARWNDKSGNGRNATNATANLPTFQGGSFNGQPSVKFARASQQYLTDGISDLTSLSIFMVQRPASLSNLATYIATSGAWAPGSVHFIQAGGSYKTLYAVNGEPADQPGNTANVTGVARLDEVIDNNGSFVYCLNGAGDGGGTSTTTKRLGSFRIGSWDGDASRYLDGNIGEVLIYGSALSAADRQAVEAYLQYKWFGIGATANILPPTTAVTIASGASLDLNGSTQTIGSLSGVSGGNLLLGAGTLTTGDASSTQFDGTISGTGRLVKQGSGTFTLGGANTYGGPTTVANGALALQGTYASSGFAIASGAVLELNVAGGTRDYAATTFSGAGTLRKTGTGTAVWQGASAAFAMGSGSLIDVQAGTLKGGWGANEVWTNNKSDLNVAAGAIFWGDEANVRVNRITGSGTIQTGYNGAGYQQFAIGVDGGSSTFAGVIANAEYAGKLVKEGAGTITLTGANTYSGSTTVANGTLALQGTYASSGFAIASGAVLELNVAGGTRDYAAITFSGAGTLRKTGTGTAVWQGAIATFAMDSGSLIDVQAGTLKGGWGANEVWTNNKSDLNVAAGAFFWGDEANVRVNRITGSGTIQTGYNGAGYQQLTIGVDGGSSTFAGVIANAEYAGKLVKEGAGTITLTGANTYSGSTTINAGKLLVNGSIGTPANPTAVIVSGGMLGGNGTINGPVNVAAAGAISAGDSPGHLVINGAYNLAGTMLAELGGTTQGVTYDWIEVNGAATLAGGSIVDVNAWNNWPSPGEGIPYYVLTATGGITNNDLSGITFDFSGAPVGPGQWKASIVPYPAGGSNAEALMLEAVPEPATLALLGVAIAGLGGYIRRRRAA